MSRFYTRKIEAAELTGYLDDFASCLKTAVEDNAGVSFVLPFTFEDARSFWIENVRPMIESGAALLIGAEANGRIVGTVQLILNQPPNQSHRCDIAKLLVHPDFRQQGIAGKLMEHIEQEAAKHDKWLLVLDTATGGVAEKFYQKIGYTPIGSIPNFGKDAIGDGYHGTTFFYKDLRNNA